MPTLKTLPVIDRPREKLQRYGPEKLSNSELLAIILGSGTKELNVLEVARRTLAAFSKAGLPNAGVDALQKTTGLGAAKASEIVACFELGRRMLQNKPARLYAKPVDIFESLRDIRDNKKEHFIVFYLDARNQEIKREIISVGTLNASLVHPREVFEPAIRHSAAHVIVAHNHPSNDPTPSAEDIAITKRLQAAGELLGIEVLDHVVVTKDEYRSLKEKALM